MTGPFEVVESDQMEDTGREPAIALVDQLLGEGGTPSPEDINKKVIREAIADVIRQRSELQDQLEDLQKDTLDEQRKFYLKLLELGDSLDRLLRLLDPANEVIETINAVRTQFLQILERIDIYPIELSLGQSFDMNICDVSSRQERPDLQPNTIIGIEQRGYKWGEKVLRHARVSISVNSKGA
ncbi:MAG: nucleotide exchange factor GrpE [Chloroflexota bacterium]